MREKAHSSHILRVRPGIIIQECQRIEVAQEQEHTHDEQKEIEPYSALAAPAPPPNLGNFVPRQEPSKVSLLIPFYNEGPFVQRAIDSAFKLLNNAESEIVAVNDGSVDDTRMKLDSITNPILHKLHLTKSSGYTTAISEGIKNTDGEYVVVLDADIAPMLFTIEPLISVLLESGATAVFLSRFPTKGFRKKLRQRFLSFLFFMLYRIRVNDVLPKCAIFKGSFARGFANASVEGNFWLNILYFIGKRKLSIREIPIQECLSSTYTNRV